MKVRPLFLPLTDIDTNYTLYTHPVNPIMKAERIKIAQDIK